MKFADVKVGQKVKFNGVIDRRYINDEFQNTWSIDHQKMNEEHSINQNKELTVSFISNAGVRFEELGYSYPASSIDLIVEEEVKDKSKLVPHVHAKVIRAWADGHTIQRKDENTGEWNDMKNPWFIEDIEYKVKPKEPAVTYGYTAVFSDGVISTFNAESVTELFRTYDSEAIKFILMKTFHDGKIVKIEVMDNPDFKE